MNRNQFLHKNILLTGVCVLLCVAILLSLCLPAAKMVRSRLDNPVEQESVREITVLKVGEDAGNLDPIVVPNGGSAMPTEPKETEPTETEPNETKPEDTETTKPLNGNGDEGNNDGEEGKEGGDELEVDLAAVLTWYRYGTEPHTVSCRPSSTVAKSINTAQLVNNNLKYAFTLTGKDAKFAKIKQITIAAGDSVSRDVSQNGNVEIELPGGTEGRNYTFLVMAVLEKNGNDGQPVRQELTFTYVLKCAHNLDLELQLTWKPTEGNPRVITCGPDKAENISVKSYDLTERVFGYSAELTGALAENAQIVSATYTTASGQRSGELAVDSGTLILDPAPGTDQETYHITFTVKTTDRDVFYHYLLNYQETLDVQLAFHWMEKGSVQRTHTCEPGSNPDLRIKNNQLSAGAIPYELELTGADGVDGRILSVAYTAQSGDSGNLEAKGALPLSMSDGASSNLYRVIVSAMVKGQRVNFELAIHYFADVSLKMEYIVVENGTAVTRQLICENTRSKTAEAVYDDQLTGGAFAYTMSLTGSEAQNVAITSVTCFQSGSGRMVTLGSEGQLALLLKEGKTGENTFEVQAQDDNGNAYRFTVNIPYKHRGQNNIQITTNLVDGQVIINGTKTNLTVRAWSEDAQGNVISYIPANGTDTKLVVRFDEETLSYISSSGASSEYDLFPENPEVGDTNTHTLYIYAEDAYGNYGERILTLNGQRRESGQETGKATIYVDMTALGLGVVANVSYDVLADEPVSYVIAKAIMGKDTGEPFGTAKDTLGWNGRYAGTLDTGFYLQSLTTGHNANALEDATWPGSTEEEVLAAIDDRFGAGTGLATLWRCLYRNGLNKSTGSGNSFGEFDYTSGSGWMYSVGGSTYYPGQSMSSVYLQDGDVLIVRYTLAYGWDVGGGSPGYGSTVGYCVSAVNGSIRVNHKMKAITNADGSVSNVCHCCGIVEACAHTHMGYRDLGDGTHIRYCDDCKQEIGDPAEHGWTYTGKKAETHHSCAECGAAESHKWKEVAGSNTATCTESGKRSVRCAICHMVREESAAPKGHKLDNKWQVTAAEHYEKCSICGEIANRDRHQYQHITFKENGVQSEDYECKLCHAFHIDECDGKLKVKTATCQKITYHCDSCGYDMSKEGFFGEYHHYAGGSCQHCGTPDPNGGTSEPPVTQAAPTP